MSERKKRQGRVYLRRSTGRQETSLQTQLEWALAEAARQQVHLEGSVADLDCMIARGEHHFRHLYLDDGITGADLDRPGFRAFVEEALTNQDISHLFAFKRDRLGRPDDPLSMMTIEQQLSRAGLTIVFNDRVVTPAFNGQTDLSHIVEMLFGYHQSGEFLKSLAERVILAQSQLAREGYWTGGNPPYGFARYLVDGEGNVVEELPKGKHVRQPGHHVRILPKDEEKIHIWVYLLDLKKNGWGIKRIAQHLNDLGIPSPGAGQVRTDHGTPHQVSGRWSPNTVSSLCRNPAILALVEYGRRSEGSHRRLGEEGPRLLEEQDRTQEGKPRVTFNEKSVIITASSTFDAQYDPEKWQQIQEQMDARSESQRGVRRAKDPSRYPLAGRVIDLTDGCGSPMYGIKHGERLIHKCGRYQRTSGAECYNNVVDAEALLSFTLKTIRHIVQIGGRRERLRELLLRRARQQAESPEMTAAQQEMFLLERKVSSLQEQKKVAARRMASEANEDRYEALAEQFDAIAAELKRSEAELERRRAETSSQTPCNPEAEVEKALRLLDEIECLAEDGKARENVATVLERLGINIGLNFTEGIKGKKRIVRKLVGGVLTFGGRELPVRLYGKDNCQEVSEEKNSPTCTDATDGVTSTQCLESASEDLRRGDGASFADSSENQSETIPLTKVNRGDKTAIELFLEGIRGWEARMRRRMLVKGVVEELGQTW